MANRRNPHASKNHRTPPLGKGGVGGVGNHVGRSPRASKCEGSPPNLGTHGPRRSKGNQPRAEVKAHPPNPPFPSIGVYTTRRRLISPAPLTRPSLRAD